MLVLSAHPGDKVHVILPDGRRAIVSVTRISTDKVRLGFEAPADIKIWRGNLLERMEDTP